MTERVIWQYWETRDEKPAFVDGLHHIARTNAGVEVILVTPETLSQYLAHIPDQVLQIQKIADKADMIRAMLAETHGGMWLDSDAIVLQDVNWLFDLLGKYEFVGFGRLKPWWGGLLDLRGIRRLKRRWEWGLTVSCFLSRPHGRIVSEWVRQQHAKLPRTVYEVSEVGSDLLGPVCHANRRRAKVLPFERICPIRWDEVETFTARGLDVDRVLRKSFIVMLSNGSAHWAGSSVHALTVEEIAAGDYLLSAIMRRALASSRSRHQEDQ